MAVITKVVQAYLRRSVRPWIGGVTTSAAKRALGMTAIRRTLSHFGPEVPGSLIMNELRKLGVGYRTSYFYNQLQHVQAEYEVRKSVASYRSDRPIRRNDHVQSFGAIDTRYRYVVRYQFHDPITGLSDPKHAVIDSNSRLSVDECRADWYQSLRESLGAGVELVSFSVELPIHGKGQTW